MRNPALAWLLATTACGVNATLHHNQQHHHAKIPRIQQHILQDHSNAASKGNGTIKITRQSVHVQENTTAATVFADDSQIVRGRFGHGAFYMTASNTILFVGGQLEEEGMYITNDVSVLNMSAPLLAGRNPSSDPSNSFNLTPTAWSASAVGSAQDIWLIGGVTSDCTTAAPAFVRGGIGNMWHKVASPTKQGKNAKVVGPPRRRQTSAVAVMNSTTWTADLWVWGGMADEYTCSPEPVGYMAIDVWHTSDSTVETYKWTGVKGRDVPAGFKPPVTDYVAVPVPDGRSIAFIGGQIATGSLADMRHILVFDTVNKTFSVKDLSKGPAPRRGHVATTIMPDQVIVHGGYNRQDKAAGNTWTLNMTNAKEWVWRPLKTVEGIHEAPKLAWHSLTAVSNTTLVAAYGLDLTTETISHDLWLLDRPSAESEEWTWTKMRARNNAVDDHPKHPHPVPLQSEATTFEQVASKPTSPSTSAVSTSAAVPTPSATASDVQDPSARTTKVVATAIGGVFASAAVAGLLFFLLKRRAQNWTFAKNKILAHHLHAQANGDLTAQPVSQLLFTRPLPQRTMSLGSPSSNRSSQPPSPTEDTVPREIVPALKNPHDYNDSGSISPLSTASVTSYPFLTAVPMLLASSSRSSAASRESETSAYADSNQPLHDSVDGEANKQSPAPGWMSYFRQSLSPKLGYVEEGSPRRSHTVASRTSERRDARVRRTRSTNFAAGASSSLSPRTHATPRFGHSRQETDASILGRFQAGEPSNR